MPDETQDDLRRINEQIPIEENAANRSYFEALLAPVFVLKRANGEFQTREMFLLLLIPGGERVCDPKSIELHPIGKTRALVTCVITLKGQAIHNTRLFALGPEGRWQLLAWANESL
jgi:hypothetical protein